MSNNNNVIWIDLDNSPHVPFFAPIIDELQQRDYSVVLTARDCFQVRGLIDLYRLKCKIVGHHSGKGGAQSVAAQGEIVGAEENISAAFDRTDCHTGAEVSANVEIAVAENFHPRCAAGGKGKKGNSATLTTVRSAVGNQGCGSGAGAIIEFHHATARTTDGGAIGGEGAIARGRAVAESRDAATDRREPSE